MAAFQEREKLYYTIVLLGKSGQGKSTTGNKLLRIDGTSIIKEWKCDSDSHFLKKTDVSTGGELSFKTGDGHYSVTNQGQMLSNEDTCVRVLDIKGLGAAHAEKHLTAEQVNAGIIEYLFDAQGKLDVVFDRIIYFLPFRGNQKRIDAYFQDEIRLLVNYFGDAIFQRMVIAATQEEEYQGYEFTSTMKDQLHEKVKSVLQAVKSDIPCPPIIYIPLCISPKELLHRVKNRSDRGFMPRAVESLSRKMCTKCCGSADSQYCHRAMVYPSDLASGLAYVYEKITEVFFYTDKICVDCRMPFGALGCTPVEVGNGVSHNC